MAKGFPILAGIDLGSSKVAALVCEMTPQGLEVVGFGQAESHGVRKGVVVNIESSVHALQEALGDAQKRAGRAVDHVVVGVAGAHIQAMSSRGMVPVRDQEIRKADVQRVIETASAVSLPLDREIVQIVPQEFIIDGQDGIQEPLGMYGKRLEVNLQVITGSITALENIRRVLSKLNLKADHFISNPLASARAVLRREEMEAGVCCVDIGSASTDLAVYQMGSLRWIRSIPIGGIHLTHDLAVGLKTNLTDAEKLKVEFGCSSHVDEMQEVEIPGLSGAEARRIKRSLFATILQPRLEEIFAMVRNELAREGIDEALPSGLVVTGGVAHTQGMMEVAERVFRLPVRMGRPSGLGGLSDMVSSPSYSSLVGMLQLGFEENDELQYYSSLYEKKGLKKVQAQFSRWFKDFF